MVPLSFAGHEFVPLPAGALFWRARGALLVADLHLEKASWYAKLGQMLPPYDSLATLANLKQLIETVQAREVWCLGDSFHDRDGCERLPAAARALLEALTARTRWTWITGNHDPALTQTCGGRVAQEEEVGGVLLRHEADPAETRPELSGHFHPKLRVAARGRRLSRRCYIVTQRKIILPAFGTLTGGLDARSPAIRRAVGAGPVAAIIPSGARLLRFPLVA